MATQIIYEATALDYAVMRLDTLDTLERAMQLYETLGFQRCAPYYANPLPGVVYWERTLADPPLAADEPDDSPPGPVGAMP